MTLDAHHTRRLLRKYDCQVVLLQDEIARSLHLKANDMKCFNILSSYGSMSPTELARRSGITTGGVSKILDRLERHGAIRRREGQDRRGLIIEIASPPNSSVAKRPDVDFDKYVKRFTEGYTADELVVICNFLDRNAEVMRAITKELHDKRKK